MKLRGMSAKLLCYGGSMLLVSIIASTSASAATLKIEIHRGAVDAATVSIVDTGAWSDNGDAVGHWGRSVTHQHEGAASAPQFFRVAQGPSGTVMFETLGSNREILAGNSTNVIPASLMARLNPPGLQNVARGLNNVGPPAVTPVPLPAAAWLFISGLLGLFLIARKRKTYAAAA